MIDGVVHQRFGPISGGSGQRRLNVLFTWCARGWRTLPQCDTRMSFQNPERHAGQTICVITCGLPKLVRCMKAAAPPGTPGVLPAPETAVMAAISKRRLSAYSRKIGVSKVSDRHWFRHPDEWRDEFILGVRGETAAAYHSSRNARDRDRLRQGSSNAGDGGFTEYGQPIGFATERAPPRAFTMPWRMRSEAAKAQTQTAPNATVLMAASPAASLFPKSALLDGNRGSPNISSERDLGRRTHRREAVSDLIVTALSLS